MKTILAIVLIMYVSAAAWATEVTLPLSAGGMPVNQDKLIGQMMTVSGLSLSLQNLPVEIATVLMQTTLRSGATVDEQQVAVKELERVLPRDAFVRHVSAALTKNYDEQRYSHFVQLLSGPVAIRLTALEGGKQNPADVQSFFTDISKQPLSQKRIKLIQRIDEASQAGRMLTQMTIASVEAGGLTTGDDCPEDLAKIRKMVANKLPDIEKANHTRTQVMLAFSYRDVSDADLETYAKIYDDKDGRWVQNIAVTAINEQYKLSMELGSRVIKNVVQAHNRKRTMFAPKCGESESPSEDESVEERRVQKGHDSQAAPKESKVSLLVTKATTGIKLASQEQNAAASQSVERKIHRSTATGTDLRSCLSLATSTEIIACTEKKY